MIYIRPFRKSLHFMYELPIHVPHIYGFVLAIHFYVCIYRKWSGYKMVIKRYGYHFGVWQDVTTKPSLWLIVEKTTSRATGAYFTMWKYMNDDINCQEASQAWYTMMHPNLLMNNQYEFFIFFFQLWHLWSRYNNGLLYSFSRRTCSVR